MPVISFANNKGGSGKTTSALVLACMIAENYDVVVIDADPRRPIVAWSTKPNKPERLTVISSGGQESIVDEIEYHAARVPFVIIDLEGTASQLGTFAMLQSDLVVIPTQEQVQDAEGAIQTVAEVRRVSKARGRAIPYTVALTRTKAAVKSKNQKAIAAKLKDIGPKVPVLNTELNERDAYASLFALGGGIRELDPKEVNGIEKAVTNAEAYTNDILAILLAAQSAAAKPHNETE